MKLTTTIAEVKGKNMANFQLRPKFKKSKRKREPVSNSTRK